MNTVESIIKRLQLQPHPEGGYFRETYRSQGTISKEVLGDAYDGARNFATGIYFLLTSENFSGFHKIVQDEQWHFYDGSSILLHLISPEGAYSKISIGRNLDQGEVPQFNVPGGFWFASEVPAPHSYALAGCTVAPGFSFNDFVLPTATQLISEFPQHKEIISRLTHH